MAQEALTGNEELMLAIIQVSRLADGAWRQFKGDRDKYNAWMAEKIRFYVDLFKEGGDFATRERRESEREQKANLFGTPRGTGASSIPPSNEEGGGLATLMAETIRNNRSAGGTPMLGRGPRGMELLEATLAAKDVRRERANQPKTLDDVITDILDSAAAEGGGGAGKNVEREWVIPNALITGAGEPMSREDAIKTIALRLQLPGTDPEGQRTPITDLIDIIPQQLWTDSALNTIDLTPFIAAMREASAGGAGTVNGVRVGGGSEGTAFTVESYAEGLDMMGEAEPNDDAVKSAVKLAFPNISEADLASVTAEVKAAAYSEGDKVTVRPRMATVEEWQTVVAKVTEGREYGGATVVNAEGETTTTPTTPTTTPGPSTSFDPTKIDLNGTGGTGMSEADMRNAYATDDLTWGQIREAWSAGTSRPTLTFGIDSSMGFDDPTGDPRVGFNRAARRVGLLDAVEQVKYITDAERKVLQKRMEDAGFFTEAYIPGANDNATKAAWQRVVADAWYEKKQVTQVLAERTAAVEQAKREALERVKQQATSTDQLSIDDGRFRFLADNMARKVLGRDLTDAEMTALRADMLAYDQQRTTTALDRSFEAGGQLQTPGPLSEAEIDANSADWMRENKTEEATWVESYSRLFTVMDTLGIKTQMPQLSSEEMQMYGAQAAANKWTPDRMFLQILVNAMDGANA